jgi:hypothetical protein
MALTDKQKIDYSKGLLAGATAKEARIMGRKTKEIKGYKSPEWHSGYQKGSR